MSDLITLKSADFEASLAVAKSFLIDNGVQCVINGEYLSVGMSGLGAVYLQVLSEDFERAKQLLIEGGFSTEEDFE